MKRLSVLMGVLLLSLLLWQGARGQGSWGTTLGQESTWRTMPMDNGNFVLSTEYWPPQWTNALGKGTKPKPNQCPVCGTMAKPYRVKRQCEKSHTEPGGEKNPSRGRVALSSPGRW